MSADLHSYLRPAVWPRSDVPGLAPHFSLSRSGIPHSSPLAVMLMPEPVPAPPSPDRTAERAKTTLAIAITGAAVVIVAALALAIVAVRHGWFG